MHPVTPHRAWSRSLSALAWALLTANAHAYEWHLDPSVASSVVYDDNPSLRVDGGDPVWGYRITPQAIFGLNSPVWTAQGTASLYVERYPNAPEEDGLDNEGGRLDFNGTRRWERSSASLGVNLRQDIALNTELETTGLVTQRDVVEELGLAPSYTYSLSERMSVSLGYQFSDVSYTGDSTLRDYQTDYASASLTRLLGESDQINVSVGFSTYRPDDDLSRFESRSLQVGAVHAFSPRLRASFSGGMSRNEDELHLCQFPPFLLPDDPGCRIPDTIRTTGDGTVFNGNLSYDWESASLSLDASRRLQPSGSEGVREVGQLNLNYSYRFSERLTARFDSTYTRSRQPFSEGGTFDDENLNLVPGFNYRLTEWWSLGGTFTHRLVREEGIEDREGDILQLTLRYAWPRIAASR
jgi:hypothetical protein